MKICQIIQDKLNINITIFKLFYLFFISQHLFIYLFIIITYIISTINNHFLLKLKSPPWETQGLVLPVCPVPATVVTSEKVRNNHICCIKNGL